MKEIPVISNYKESPAFAIVDDEDYERVSQYRWRATGRNYKGRRCLYPFSYVHSFGYTVAMHRVIMPAPKGFITDHINGDRFDNRRSNLRVCSKAENCQNRKRSITNSDNKYKGVHKHGRKYLARIMAHGEKMDLGSYQNEILAAAVYDEAAIKYHGQFARTNFTPEYRHHIFELFRLEKNLPMN